MKKLTILVAFLLANIFGMAQLYPFKERETTITEERYFPVPTQALTGDFEDSDDVYAMSRAILAIPNDGLSTKLTELVNLSSDNWAIIFVHNAFKQAGSNAIDASLKELSYTVLHKERKSWTKDYEWSNYLYNTKNIIVILLGQTGLDGEHSPIELGFSIDNKDSFAKKSFKDLVSVIKQVLLESDVIDKVTYTSKHDVPCRLVYFKEGSILPPSAVEFSVPVLQIEETKEAANALKVVIENTKLQEIDRINEVLINNELILNGETPSKSPLIGHVEFTLPTKKINTITSRKNIKVDIHEKNYFGFSIGITGAQFDRKDFFLDTLRNIAIATLDSAKQKDWLGNLNVNLEFYPFGRDIDRFEPFLKKPFYKLHTRFGFFGGVRLSKDPLSAVNTGFSFAYSRTVALTFGWTWVDNRIADEQQVNVGENVKDINAAKDFFKRKYELSKFSIGITFAPTEIAKALGIGEDKKEED